jgi:hypothetical protein
MGLDKVHDHLRHGAEYVVSPDMSCLMHQQGVARRGGLDLKYVHVAQVLNGGPFARTTLPDSGRESSHSTSPVSPSTMLRLPSIG